jgi:H+/Cl- antiporter ClcA
MIKQIGFTEGFFFHKIIQIMRIKLKSKWASRILGLIKNKEIRNNLLKALPFWMSALFTGIVAVIYARFFGLAENIWNLIYKTNPWLLLLITPVCFLLSWWLVKKFAPFSGGSGIPQVMASLESVGPLSKGISKLLSMRVIIIKFLSSIIMVAGGGAVGREGPTIQIAGSVFKKVNDFLPVWWPRISEKNMIVSGAAAGLAAAFNSPLAGIVFAIEELSKIHFNEFKVHVFSGVIIAGITVQTLFGSYLYIGVPNISVFPFTTHFAVVMVAVICALFAGLMSKIMLFILQRKGSFTNLNHVLYLITGALAIAIMAIYINESILGSGRWLMTSTLLSENKHVEWYVPLLRISGNILSFTSGASGGIFAPALSNGASIGAVISGWLHFSPSETNILILSGMVAFLTGVTRAPFTCAIVVLEMTDSNSMILFFMLSAIVSNIASLIIDKHSIYEYLKILNLKQLQTEEEKVVSQPDSTQKIN